MSSSIASEIVAIIFLVGIVLMIVFYRQKLFALLVDLFIGTMIFLAALFGISWLGIFIPPFWADVAYVFSMLAFIGYHIIINLSSPSRSRSPYGSL